MTDLNERFIAEANERAERIGALLQALTAISDPSEVCEEIRDHAHKLKGAAGVFGFPELRDRAADLEQVAKSQSGASSGAGAAAVIASAFAGLTAALPV